MAQTTDEIRGIGHSVKRKEDDRFIRGRGNYIDDMQLPGMLLHVDPAEPLRPREAQQRRHVRGRGSRPA